MESRNVLTARSEAAGRTTTKAASAGAQNSSFILLPVAMLAIGLDVGTASLGLGQLCGPAVGGVLADWIGPSGVGWFAAAIYGAAMLAAAGDGFFSRTWTPTP